MVGGPLVVYVYGYTSREIEKKEREREREKNLQSAEQMTEASSLCMQLCCPTTASLVLKHSMMES